MRCKVCGQVMIDDIEVGQGYCITAPCWMYVTGQLAIYYPQVGSVH